MNPILKLSLREILRHRGFALFFAFNLALGLIGFALLDAFKISLERSVHERSKNLLSADLAISARRELNPDEQSLVARDLPSGTRQGEVITTYSMVAGADLTRLIELRGIDQTYPFYGQLELEHQGVVTARVRQELLDAPKAWVDPEILIQLGVAIGSEVKIGGRVFKVVDAVKNDSANAWKGFSLAPRVYIGISQLQATGLLAKGSAVDYRHLYALPSPIADQETASGNFAKILNRDLKDPGIQVTTHRAASEQVGRLLDYMNDYLGLVALVAFFLAGVGSAYLFRDFIAQRLKDIAILLSLGLTHSRAQALYLIQLGVLGLLATLATAVICTLVLPLLSRLVKIWIPFELSPVLAPRTLLLALLMGCLGSLLVCLPLLLRIRKLKPGALFQEQEVAAQMSITKKTIAAFVPALLIYWLLASWEAHSWMVGSLFLGGVLGSTAVLGAIAWSGLRLLDRALTTNASIRPGFTWMKLGLRNMARSRLSSLSCFLAVGISALLIHLIPQLRRNIEAEFIQPDSASTPGLFLFDIQDEQARPLEDFMTTRGLKLKSLSPVIRARLVAINGAAFTKDELLKGSETREEEQESRSRNRSFNLTFRSRLSESETILEGKPVQGTWDPAAKLPAEMSVEFRFAERLHLKLGDVMKFDIQGVEIEGRIVNLRKVRWTSFEPNFFIEFQPGALEEAPKTYIAAVPALNTQSKARLQSELVKQFPNISAVDVSRLVQKIMEIFAQMGWAIQIMAYLSLGAGLVVLFAICRHQANLRKKEASLMRILGARSRQVQAVFLIEFGTLGLLGAVFGVSLSTGMSYLISVLLFDGDWSFSWVLPLSSVAVVLGLSILTSVLAARRVLREKPISLLQSSG